MRMRKLMIGLALAGVSMAALPAAAQDWDDDRDRRGGYGEWDRGDRSDSLRRASWMLDRAIRRGSLSRGEANHYRNELRQIYHLEARFRRDGYSRWEREQINDRANRLIYRLRAERRDDRYRDRWDDDRREDRWDD
ncbi:hypothetical protein [Sphingomonas koreensis]|uniref:hypothetical protein n=2 Tax=Sphingomonas koreensis TaxID=93064 RepID=UPI001B879F49|nr:hypothetical protein [Sphingomonas koreensis]